jgi:hypothetical protein
VLFDPADPDEPALHATARPLIHLQQLMHELATSDYSTDTIPDLVLAAPRRPSAGAALRTRKLGVAGELRDASHEPVGAGTVTLIAENGRQVACGWPDATGKYRLEAPASGTYLIVVTAPGCHPVAARVGVAANRDSAHDFTLEKLPQGRRRPRQQRGHESPSALATHVRRVGDTPRDVPR